MNAIICKKIWAVLFVIVALGICATARAGTVVLGSDYLATLPGTYANLGPPLGTVDFLGVPIGPGTTDTIIQRLQDIPINGTPTGPNLMITALSLEGTGSYASLYVSLDPANLANDTGTMTINGSTSGGTFSSFLDVYFDICLAPGVNGVGCGTGTTPVATGNFVLTATGTWSPTPSSGAVIVSGPVGDLAADVHTGLGADEVDFFPVGTIYETGPAEEHIVTVATPEPGTLLLLGTGLAALGSRARKRQSRKA